MKDEKTNESKRGIESSEEETQKHKMKMREERKKKEKYEKDNTGQHKIKREGKIRKNEE